MKKMTWKLLLAVVIATLMLTLLALGVSAEEPSELDIYAKNLTFDNEVYILYAVKSDDPTIKLQIWTEGPLVGTPTLLSPIFGQDVDGTVCTVFKYTDLSAKQMTDVVYARTVVTDGETETYGALCKYSILQYAYNKLGKTGTASENEALKAMLIGMLDYGALAQTYFNYQPDRPANVAWVQVELVGGTLPDGFAKGLYLPGDAVTITAPAINESGAPFARWIDGTGATVSADATATLTVGDANATYTAVYESYTYSEGLAFTLNDDGASYSVSGIGTCTDTDIIIPSTYEGLPVTGVGNYAFNSCRTMTSIVMPDSITSIGNSAFSYCTGLASMTIPNSVTSIGGDAFYSCTSLIQKENGVSYVDKWVVACDYSATAVVLRNNTVGLGDYAFEYCSHLVSITLPDSVTRISEFAFAQCTGLTSITIPGSITSIGSYAFYFCNNLTSITYDGTKTQWEAIEKDAYWNANIGKYVLTTIEELIEELAFTLNDDGVSYSVSGIGTCTDTDIIIPSTYEGLPVTGVGDSAFYNSTSLTSITIPDSVTRIGNEAFYKCTELTSVSIGNGVTYFGSYAFRDCSKLAKIIYNGAKVQWETISKGSMWDYNIGDYVLITKSAELAFTLNDDGVSYSVSGIGTCTGDVEIPAVYNGQPVVAIGNDAFKNCTDLTSVIIPDSITSIGDYAFYFSYLTSITIPNSVTSIGDSAFFGCSGLKSAVIPDSVESIGGSIFAYCSGLTSVTIGSGVKSIGSGAFAYCSRLQKVYITDLAAWCNINFSYYYDTPFCYASELYLNGSLVTDLVIPDNLTSIGSYAFSGCTGLTSVTIGNGAGIPNLHPLEDNGVL